MKKKILTVILISLVGIGFLFPDELRIVSHGENLTVLRDGAQIHHLSLKNAKDSTGVVIDTIFYYHPPEDDENYDDFIAGYQGIGKDPSDTCITWFTLLGPGKITKLFMQNEKSGLATWHIWAPAINRLNGTYQFPNESSVQPLFSAVNPHDCSAQSPSAQFIVGKWQPEWNIFDLTAEYSKDVLVNQDSLDIWVGYSTDNDGGPTIWQDGYIHDSESEGDCRAFTTLHSVEMGKWYRNIQAGNNQTWIAHMMQIEVEYDNLPPIITDVSRFSDTFDHQKTISAKIVEIGGESFTAKINFKIGGKSQLQSKFMKEGQDNQFTETIDANPGDTVIYYITAEDATGLKDSSGIEQYAVCIPPEMNSILLIKDNDWNVDSLYINAFNSVGKGFYLWNTRDHRGIDKSVIHCPKFALIAIFGGNSRIVPMADSSIHDIYDLKDYLEDGGGLLISDMDYFFSWKMPTSGRLGEGSFAYDYLGIGGFENDPDDSIETEGGTADIEMTGIAGETLTVEFQTPDYYGPLRFDLIGGLANNWSDFILPGSGGVSIFKGRQSNKDMAVRKEGSRYRSVFFSFPIELANFAEFSVLLSKTIDWLENRPVGIKNDESPKILRNWVTNFPNPFNSNTKIQYQLKDQGISKIVVYNIYGQVVLVLVDKIQSQGKYEIEWNGRDVHGVTVASGIYFLRVETGRDVFTRKMLIIR